MQPEEISRLLKPFLGPISLSSVQIRQVSAYLDLLLKWNSKVNLTAVRSPEEIVSRHFGESFFAARVLITNHQEVRSAIDVGSGAGFPGLPMKIWAPRIEMKLIESNQKKAVFIREVARAIELSDVEVLSQRAEDLELRSDLVTLRAVEHFEQIVPVAARLLRPGGKVGLLIGSSQVMVARRRLPNAIWKEPIAIPNSHNRILLVGSVPTSESGTLPQD